MNKPGRVVMLEGLASTITDDELEYLIERIGAYRVARVVPYLKDTRRVESDPASEASDPRREVRYADGDDYKGDPIRNTWAEPPMGQG